MCTSYPATGQGTKYQSCQGSALTEFTFPTAEERQQINNYSMFSGGQLLRKVKQWSGIGNSGSGRVDILMSNILILFNTIQLWCKPFPSLMEHESIWFMQDSHFTDESELLREVTQRQIQRPVRPQSLPSNLWSFSLGGPRSRAGVSGVQRWANCHTGQEGQRQE